MVIASWFNEINLSNLRGDLFGGVTAAIVSLPLALAFGVASGAGAEAGLYGAILIGLFAALFGGTSTLISEPTGPMTVVMAAVLTNLVAQNPENGLAMAFTVVMIAGAFQILLGILNLGKYITLMPYSVISGFMSGIGLILIILQLPSLLGHDNPGGGVVGNLTAIPSLLSEIRWPELALGLITLAILFWFPKKLAVRVPPQLIALIVGSVIALTLFSGDSIRAIGEVSLGVPSLILPTFTADQITQMVLDGIVLGTLGCIDALLTAVIADSLTRKEHDSRKELIGQGIGNMVSGLCGGLPGAGATMGTVVNIQAGARTALSGITRAMVLLILVVFAAGLTAYIPLAVLAAIAIKVGLNILDWSFLKRAHRVSKTATMIMYGVMLLTVFVDLIVAVGIGVFIANILTIEKLSRLQAKNIYRISDTDDSIPLTQEEISTLAKGNGKVMLMYFSGPMMFGVSRAIAREHENIHAFEKVVFDLTDVPLIDATVSLAIENAVKDAVDNDKQVFIACPSTATQQTFQRMGLIDLVGEQNIVESREEALEKAVAS
ncbi:SulP family inorganic anion transporter [Motilimonas pumila]|uniref:SulP family inorganic anion transporter n=1 Tax=Motilimonas pumila TaxID=2303987 RepID=A0A418YFY4_9GAMM|nr:SulP family inorganic anion transporter [Motilimonas pumila]RJG48458.1 SulP family inorganic anion transporter [Motilimonas pumila]